MRRTLPELSRDGVRVWWRWCARCGRRFRVCAIGVAVPWRRECVWVSRARLTGCPCMAPPEFLAGKAFRGWELPVIEQCHGRDPGVTGG